MYETESWQVHKGRVCDLGPGCSTHIERLSPRLGFSATARVATARLSVVCLVYALIFSRCPPLHVILPDISVLAHVV